MNKQPNLLLSHMKVTQTHNKFNRNTDVTKTKTQKLETVATIGDKNLINDFFINLTVIKPCS